ncbi:6-bladed beta-propeller [Paludibacter sp. 221]|uniref:6-bladed beta-propeller n=1 Tax=Paludibacter sp. 221 TaxID=2302939 RepID=UPI0013D7ECAE|nr:6-bladed beta-propeller [Paludibacter sp. 221]NDV46568.1 6-bladed beta-propeller [Paludibacter sp. 221]
MKKNYFFIALIISIAFFNCSKKNIEENDIIVKLNEKEIINYNSVIDSIKYIKLETKKESLISNIKKILMDNNNLYIQDNLSRIFVFNSQNGLFKYVIDKVGQGPGEYIHIQDFCLNKQNIEILDIRRKQIIHYKTEDGSYDKSFTLKKFTYSIFPLNNENYLTNLPNDLGDNNKFGVDLLDANYTVKKNLLEYSGKYPLFSENESIFSELDSNTYGILSIVEGAIYHFSESSFEKKYSFAFNGKDKVKFNKGKTLLSNNSQELLDKIAYIRFYKETMHNIILNVINANSIYLIIYSKSEGKAHNIKYLSGHLPLPTAGFLKSETRNTLFNSIAPDIYLELIENEPEFKKNIDKELYSLIMNSTEDSNPILQVIHLK